jgi:thiamine biosynthesis lipoprotein
VNQLPGALSRRRFITVAAAAVGCACVPGGVLAESPPCMTWNGIALGAPARLTLQCPNEEQGREAIAACLLEIARLEAIFSLHRADSALVRLNESARLDDAPIDLQELLGEALALAARTEGAFDPTVQPLWQYLSQPGQGTPQERNRIRDLIGWQNVHIDGGVIRFSKLGMAVTLNGIAQGYITDKVGDVLRQRGFRHVIADMGEQLALGPKWDGTAWQIGIRDPEDDEGVMHTFPLMSGAVATSGNRAAAPNARSRQPHILDPRTGQPVRQWASLTVVADTATRADGLSTALMLLPLNSWHTLLGPAIRVYAKAAGAKEGFWV